MRNELFSEAWLISVLFSVSMVLLTILRPVYGRMMLSLIFLAAGFINTVLVVSQPDMYLVYGDLAALSSYEHFIEGVFSRHIPAFILPIALLQMAIGIGLMWRDPLEKVALCGAVIFLLAIAPLGAGSAFPSTVLLALAAILLLFKRAPYPWIWLLVQPRAIERSMS